MILPKSTMSCRWFRRLQPYMDGVCFCAAILCNSYRSRAQHRSFILSAVYISKPSGREKTKTQLGYCVYLQPLGIRFMLYHATQMHILQSAIYRYHFGSTSTYFVHQLLHIACHGCRISHTVVLDQRILAFLYYIVLLNFMGMMRLVNWVDCQCNDGNNTSLKIYDCFQSTL